MTRIRPYRTRAEDLAPDAMRSAWSPTHRQLIELWLDIAKRYGYRVSVYHDSRGEHWGADSEQRTWLASLDRVPGIRAGIWRSSGDRVRDAQSVVDILGVAPAVLPRGRG